MIRHCIASRHCDNRLGCDIKHSRADGSLCLITAEEDAGTGQREDRVRADWNQVAVGVDRGSGAAYGDGDCGKDAFL